MDKRTLFAFLLIAVIILLTPAYYNIIYPPTEDGIIDSLVVNSPQTSGEQTAYNIKPMPTTNTKIPENKEIHQEQVFTIENALFSAEISSNNGGSFTSFSLKQYPYLNNGQVQLINEHNKNNLSLSFRSVDGETVIFDRPWEPVNNLADYGYIETPTTLKFKTSFNGVFIYKNITFYPDHYYIDVHTDLSNIEQFISQGVYQISWDGGLPVTEKNTSDDLNYFNAYIYQGEELHSPKISDINDIKVDHKKGETDWVAVRSKYFVSAMIPSNKGLGATTSGYAVEKREKIFSVSLSLSADHNKDTKLYFGPLEYYRIRSLNVGLDSIMNFGWTFIRPIAKGIHYLLIKMHIYIPNYGVVLIIFSLLIKILVYPLTKKSYESTQKMQAVQPQLNALKEKYKNDQQKMSQAQMALFKEHGVNPLGGCFPILLQMPLLFSLFRVFRSTIELRGAPFVFWIKDLSSPDTIIDLPFTIPIYGDHIAVLPILMGITMFLQQKMMPSQAGAQQKMMSYFMTGFFTLLFNNFPSGLNLYYTLFNILTILQQKFLTPHNTSIQKPTKQK